MNGVKRGIKEVLNALNGEGIPCMRGYQPLQTMPFLENAFQTKNFKRMYPGDMLNINEYNEQNKCPASDQLYYEEAVWLAQNMLPGPKTDMDDVLMAIEKIHRNAEKIKNKK